MPDQQQQIEEDLELVTHKGVYQYECMNDSKNHSYHPKTPSVAH